MPDDIMQTAMQPYLKLVQANLGLLTKFSSSPEVVAQAAASAQSLLQQGQESAAGILQSKAFAQLAQGMLNKYAALQQRYSAVLAGLDPILLERRRGPLPRYQVRIGADTRSAANDLCKQIHKSGGDCVVLRNPRT